jgi:hypothetical protein
MNINLSSSVNTPPHSPYVVIAMGITSERPSNPLPGTLFFNVEGSLEIFDGAAWINTNSQ